MKLPELLAFVNMEKDAPNKLQIKLLDILKYAFLLQSYACQPFFLTYHSDGFSVRFIQKNQSTFFTTVYCDDGRKSADGAKTK